MHISINGESIEVSDGINLEEFLLTKQISKDGKGIAVAVNEDVIPKSGWNSVELAEGMRVEIVQAVQGG